jgi:hypothetical protein
MIALFVLQPYICSYLSNFNWVSCGIDVMDSGSSLSQPALSRRGRRRRSSNISIPQIDSSTYQENWRIRRARMNGGTNPNILVADHQPATPTTHEHSSTAGPSKSTIVILVLSLCYGSLICVENLATFPWFLLHKNIILWDMNQILLKLKMYHYIYIKDNFR